MVKYQHATDCYRTAFIHCLDRPEYVVESLNFNKKSSSVVYLNKRFVVLKHDLCLIALFMSLWYIQLYQRRAFALFLGTKKHVLT